VAAFTTSEWNTTAVCHLQPDDVVVADSAYGTYVDLALVFSKCRCVFRKHHARHCDFRRGKKLGIGDHIVQWQRLSSALNPVQRILRYQQALKCAKYLLLQQPGFRPEIILVTTLVDPKRYSKPG